MSASDGDLPRWWFDEDLTFSCLTLSSVLLRVETPLEVELVHVQAVAVSLSPVLESVVVKVERDAVGHYKDSGLDIATSRDVVLEEVGRLLCNTSQPNSLNVPSLDTSNCKLVHKVRQLFIAQLLQSNTDAIS